MKTRERLSASGLFGMLRAGLEKTSDHRTVEMVKISLADTLMSAFAMFSLKDQQRRVFDKRRKTDSNLKQVC
jgi:hypothetical protein